MSDKVIGVRFKKAGKIYYFNPLSIPFEVGEGVIVETSRGIEFGEVVIGVREMEQKELQKPLRPVIRRADEEDYARIEANQRKEKEAFSICEEKIKKHGMDMKLINVEYTFDNSKIVFYFTAEGRVDFRDLVKDLASVFKTRIELRQIGVRDETKMLGGLGPCGRPACCAEFLGDFQPVSIKMAKEQNLSLSPTKISGLCGRLMCCLGYEHEYYKELSAILPRNGSEVQTPDGTGVVMESNPLRQLVKVKIAVGDEFDVREYPVGEISVQRRSKRPPEKQEAPEKGKDAEKREPARAEKAEKAEGKKAEKPRRQDRPKRGGKPPRGPRPERRQESPKEEM